MFSLTGVEIALSGSVSGRRYRFANSWTLTRRERQQRVEMLPVGARALCRQRARRNPESETWTNGRREDRGDQRHQQPIERYFGAVGGPEVLKEAALELTLDDVGERLRIRRCSQLLLVGEEHEDRAQVIAVGPVIGQRPREEVPAYAGLGLQVDVEQRLAFQVHVRQLADRHDPHVAGTEGLRIQEPWVGLPVCGACRVQGPLQV